MNKKEKESTGSLEQVVGQMISTGVAKLLPSEQKVIVMDSPVAKVVCEKLMFNPNSEVAGQSLIIHITVKNEKEADKPVIFLPGNPNKPHLVS